MYTYIYIYTHTYVYIYIYIYIFICSFIYVGRLGFQSGVGADGLSFYRGGHESHTFCDRGFASSAHRGCHMLPSFATFGICLSPVAIFCNIFLVKLIMGNCGASVTTPFVLTPSGSCEMGRPEWALLGGKGRPRSRFARFLEPEALLLEISLVCWFEFCLAMNCSKATRTEV